jgi:hypothetical protein
MDRSCGGHPAVDLFIEKFFNRGVRLTSSIDKMKFDASGSYRIRINSAVRSRRGIVFSSTHLMPPPPDIISIMLHVSAHFDFIGIDF